jgi:hypothetical protein
MKCRKGKGGIVEVKPLSYPLLARFDQVVKVVFIIAEIQEGCTCILRNSGRLGLDKYAFPVAAVEIQEIVGIVAVIILAVLKFLGRAVKNHTVGRCSVKEEIVAGSEDALSSRYYLNGILWKVIVPENAVAFGQHPAGLTNKRIPEASPCSYPTHILQIAVCNFTYTCLIDPYRVPVARGKH